MDTMLAKPLVQQDCDIIEVWLESGDRIPGIDKILGEDLEIDGNALYLDGRNAGRVVDVSNSEGQSFARSLAGSVDWILLEFGEWKMIPIENIIAACDSSPTKVAARITKTEQILGATFALEIGVDAIFVPNELAETALIAKSQKGERDYFVESNPNNGKIELTNFEVSEVREGMIGDRVCIDLISMLEIGDGMLVGSNSKSLVLVHGETVESEFVPTRPFRVNAGPVNAYILMADSSTKYLSELTMGDEVMVVNSSGGKKSATIGRIKIENRPFLLIKWTDEDNNQGGTLLQQAETVRLVLPSRELISITEIRPKDKILGATFKAGRHIGIPIKAEVSEK